MAYERIKGITIEINGDVTGLNKALESTNKKLSSSQNQLRDVERLLKLDPKNTELLAQKQRILGDAIGATKEKLEKLKKAEQQAAAKLATGGQEAQEQYEALRREIISTEGYLGKLEKQAKDAGKSVGDAAQDAEGKVSGFGSVAKAAGVAAAAAFAAAAAAAVKIGKTVIDEFGELEQNLGGSEAVFGDFAASIQKTGEDAYKNLGISQSEYLATANKMGALFQGSGLSQQKSLELTTQAMQRAADMASVMGIDTASAMEAVAGAAKGNYTMMDNLGVAMNDTTLSAYAMSKGYDTAWASMSNAEKAEVAMQYFFENTEQYAGNFAKEATETISGSFGLLSAATSSFIAGLGNSEADIQSLADNVIDALTSVIDNVFPVIENMGSALPELIEQMIPKISDKLMTFLPDLIKIAGSLVSALAQGIVKNLPQIVSSATTTILTLVKSLAKNLPMIIQAGAEALGALIQGIADALPELIPAIIDAVILMCETLVNNLPLILDAALQLIEGLAQGLLDALPRLIERLPEIITGIVNFLLDAIPQIIETGIQLLTSLVAALPEIIVAVVDAIPQIISGIVNAIIGNVPRIVQAGVQLMTSLIKNLPTIIAEIVKAVPQIIKGIVKAFGDLTGEIANVGKNIVKGLWEGIQQLEDWLWDKVCGWISGIWDGICDFFGIHSPSREMAWVGEMLVKGLSGSIEDNGDEAVKAAEGMAADIDGVMNDLAHDMQAALPTDFDVTGNVHSALKWVWGILPCLQPAMGSNGGGQTSWGAAATANPTTVYNSSTSLGGITVYVSAPNVDNVETLADLVADRINTSIINKQAVYA